MEQETLRLLAKKNLTLEQLAETHPLEWDRVQKEVCKVLETAQTRKISEYAVKTKKHTDLWNKRIKKSGHNAMVIKSALPHLVRGRLSHLAINKYIEAATKKRKRGRGRGKRNISIKAIKEKLGSFLGVFLAIPYKKYLTKERINHPPLSLEKKAFLWKYVTNKPQLLSHAYRNGVYCVYTKELIEKLSKMIEGHAVLEIAAGDGALSQFLGEKSKIIATDDYSWARSISYHKHVENLDAKKALKKYQPKIVLSCFPPAPNNFEKHVFQAPSVELYIVIGSRHSYATGDFGTYKRQKGFSWQASLSLSKLVFPQEIDPCVYIFRRL